MTRTEIKRKAKEELLFHAGNALIAVYEDGIASTGTLTESEALVINAEMGVQLRRIKKLFGVV